MSGHRCYDQHPRLRRAQGPGELAIEIQEAAKRLFPNGANFDRDAKAVDVSRVDAPFRLSVTARGALEQFAGRRNRLADLGVRPWIEWILKQDFRSVGDGARRGLGKP